MGRALVLNTASKASTTGGTFADVLAANSGDSLQVANYSANADASGAKVTEMWAIDSAHVAEVAVTLTRQQSVNDQSRGMRFNIPAAAGAAAGFSGARRESTCGSSLPVLAACSCHHSSRRLRFQL